MECGIREVLTYKFSLLNNIQMAYAMVCKAKVCLDATKKCGLIKKGISK